jgi:hypothetical protein
MPKRQTRSVNENELAGQENHAQSTVMGSTDQVNRSSSKHDSWIVVVGADIEFEGSDDFILA